MFPATTICFLLAINKLIAYQYNTCDKEDVDNAEFRKVGGHELLLNEEDILFTKTVKVPQSCLGVCRMHQMCRSFNVVKYYSNGYRCQFAKVNRFNLPAREIKSNESNSYFELILPHSCWGTTLNPFVPAASDCVDIYEMGFKQNGFYGIRVGNKKIFVFCDMEVQPPGWVVVQRRVDGQEDFHRSWYEYEKGFGRLEPTSEFWLGNEIIHLMTKGKSNSVFFRQGTHFAFYNVFNIAPKEDSYRITCGEYYDGNTGDVSWVFTGMEFATRDNDKGYSCVSAKGGFWHNPICPVSLNGDFATYTHMMMRRKN